MQSENGETEGIIALRRLQNNDFKLWTKEEIENSLSKRSKQICFYVAKRNNLGEIPSKTEVKKSLKIGSSVYTLIEILKGKEIIFDFTIPEIAGFYGLDYLGFRVGGHFFPPEHLESLKKYLDRVHLGSRGSKTPWHQMIRPENVKSSRYPCHLVANLKDDRGLPCYLPLGLHIPKH